jgi:hypothetical protein
MKLRSDCGTENGIMAGMQCEFRSSSDAHFFRHLTCQPEDRKLVVPIQKKSFHLVDKLFQGSMRKESFQSR